MQPTVWDIAHHFHRWLIQGSRGLNMRPPTRADLSGRSGNATRCRQCLIGIDSGNTNHVAGNRGRDPLGGVGGNAGHVQKHLDRFRGWLLHPQLRREGLQPFCCFHVENITEPGWLPSNQPALGAPWHTIWSSRGEPSWTGHLPLHTEPTSTCTPTWMPRSAGIPRCRRHVGTVSHRL